MGDPTKLLDTGRAGGPSAHGAGGRTERLAWWVIGVVLALCLSAVLSRNVIRAYWWADRLAAAVSPNERLGYFYHLTGLGDTAVPAVLPLLADEDAGLRSFGVGVLHHAPGDRAFGLLVRAAQDADLDVARLAMKGLAVRAGARSVKELSTIAKTPAPGDERRAMIATTALADLGSEAAVHCLLELLRSSPSSGVRVEAIEGLAMLRAEEAVEDLVAGLDDDSVFEGVTERDIVASRVYQRAAGDLTHQLDLPETTRLVVKKRHVLWKRAAEALQAITGHSPHGVQQEFVEKSKTAKAWRDWWIERGAQGTAASP